MCLFRSKDIETSGFNGTAAFMEVRVQSIVVEFILTHVPQLFPELGKTSWLGAITGAILDPQSVPDPLLLSSGVSQERRNSLPSPTAASCQEEGLVKSASAQPASYGNISPGDGPLRITPYHAIIEGTDKWANWSIYLRNLSTKGLLMMISPLSSLYLVQAERLSQRQEVDVHLQHRRTVPRSTPAAQTLDQRYKRNCSRCCSRSILPAILFLSNGFP